MTSALDRWRARALPEPRSEPPRLVRLRLAGEICRAPGARWVGWTGAQDLEAAKLGFRWQARLQPTSLLWIRAMDALQDDIGVGSVKAWGLIRLIHRTGEAVTTTQLLRNLAELAFVPWSSTANPRLGWRDLGPNGIEVSATAGGVTGIVTFEVDDRGDIVAATAPDRPYEARGELIPTPWRMAFANHAETQGVIVPTVISASYDFPDGRWEYWRSRVLDLELIG
jgi:hypothetical protein